MRTLTSLTVVCLLMGCGGSNAPQSSNLDSTILTESSTNEVRGSSLEERAELIGVPLALAESWEQVGVYIGESGLVYAEECQVISRVKIPAGIKIVC